MWLLEQTDGKRHFYLLFKKYEQIEQWFYRLKEDIKKIDEYKFYNIDRNLDYKISLVCVYEE